MNAYKIAAHRVIFCYASNCSPGLLRTKASAFRTNKSLGHQTSSPSSKRSIEAEQQQIHKCIQTVGRRSQFRHGSAAKRGRPQGTQCSTNLSSVWQRQQNCKSYLVVKSTKTSSHLLTRWISTQISWIRHHDLHILTVGGYTYTADMRFRSVYNQDSEEWILQIQYVQRRDEGRYECQINTQPVRSFFVHLKVIGTSPPRPF